MKKFWKWLLVALLGAALLLLIPLRLREPVEHKEREVREERERFTLSSFFARLTEGGAADAEAAEVAELFLAALNDGDIRAEAGLLAPEALVSAAYEPVSANGRLLREATASLPHAMPEGELLVEGRSALLRVRLYAADPEALRAPLSAALQEGYDAAMAEARRGEELLNADGSVKEDVLATLGGQALQRVLAEPIQPVAGGVYELRLTRSGEDWLVSDAAALTAAARGVDTDALAAELLAGAAEALVATPKHYSLPLDAREGQPPDPAAFGETDDPAVILALLERPEAQRLLEGKELIWRADIERFPDSTIHYYLDETILALVWQEVTAWAQGTYAEIIVADGSQLCRKLSGDDFYSEEDHLPTTYAAETRAVVTLGGDFYRYPGRYNGICVYEGKVCRFEPESSDSCFVTESGELLFVYRNQFETQEQAEAYIEEHKVRFSLCFGPAVIENGEDVSPERYRWGEIYDNYARAMLGCKEELHYLALTINAKTPGYYYLATLADATEAMLSHGCTRAYTLDGGQTATIVIGDQVVNTVQFGEERAMSDVIFFGSALPPEDAA